MGVCINAGVLAMRSTHIIVRASDEEISQVEALAKIYGSKSAAIRRGLSLLTVALEAQAKTPAA
jgi:hypothetical protein